MSSFKTIWDAFPDKSLREMQRLIRDAFREIYPRKPKDSNKDEIVDGVEDK